MLIILSGLIEFFGVVGEGGCGGLRFEHLNVIVLFFGGGGMYLSLIDLWRRDGLRKVILSGRKGLRVMIYWWCRSHHPNNSAIGHASKANRGVHLLLRFCANTSISR